MVKRAGKLRTRDIGAGELVVRCPTCPRPGVNIPEDWESDEDKYTFRHAFGAAMC